MQQFGFSFCVFIFALIFFLYFCYEVFQALAITNAYNRGFQFFSYCSEVLEMYNFNINVFKL